MWRRVPGTSVSEQAIIKMMKAQQGVYHVLLWGILRKHSLNEDEVFAACQASQVEVVEALEAVIGEEPPTRQARRSASVSSGQSEPEVEATADAEAPAIADTPRETEVATQGDVGVSPAGPTDARRIVWEARAKAENRRDRSRGPKAAANVRSPKPEAPRNQQPTRSATARIRSTTPSKKAGSSGGAGAGVHQVKMLSKAPPAPPPKSKENAGQAAGIRMARAARSSERGQAETGTRPAGHEPAARQRSVPKRSASSQPEGVARAKRGRELRVNLSSSSAISGGANDMDAEG